jgi:hypothetical protein
MKTKESSPTIRAAETVRDAAQAEVTRHEEALAALDAQLTGTKAEVERIKRLDDTEIQPADLAALDYLPRRIRRLEGERGAEVERLATARAGLAAPERELDRLRLPLVLADMTALGGSITERVRAAASSLAADFKRLGELKTTCAQLGASAGEPVNFDAVALGWSTTRGDETGCAPETGIFADHFMFQLAKSCFNVRRIEESARADEARRAREETERARLAAMTPEECESAALAAWPGRNRAGPARLSPDDPTPLRKDADFDPFGAA